ncbi:ParA family protein [Chlamydiota bacterium]
MKIISIANQKGGSGKTTTAVNLGASLSTQSLRVLLIDLDPQGHSTIGIGIDPDELSTTIYDAIVKPPISIQAVIKKTYLCGLDIAPSNILLSGADLDLSNTIGRETILKEKLAIFKDEYDYIIIDCSPSLNILTVNSLTASDYILIPIQTHYYAMEGMKQLFSTIDLVKRRLNPTLKLLGILPTMYDKRTNISKDVLEGIRDFFGAKVLNTIININVKLTEAPSSGEAVLTYSPESTGARDYQNLAKEILYYEKKNRA